MKRMKRNIFIAIILIAPLIIQTSCNPGSHDEPTSIVILVGEKSHPAGMHEYIKASRLIKAMIEHSDNMEDVTVRLVYQGWPEDESLLDSADLIIAMSDGRDGPETAIPFMYSEERMDIMQKQMARGCGLMTFHYTTFAPNQYGEKILDWTGGYFDWLDDNGEDNWYSDLTTITAAINFPSHDHPVCNGVSPFRYEEEFYYDIRFREADPRLVPLVVVPDLETQQELGKVVAWSVQRDDGGRGFGTTMGHNMDAFSIDDFRKFILNAVAWTAGIAVPDEGIESGFYTDREVTQLIYGKSIKGLVLTGHHHPGHSWQETTPVIVDAMKGDERIHMDVSTNIEDLFQYTLDDYDFLVLNYCNWELPGGLSQSSKDAFTAYLVEGGGLLIIHFTNGAWHFSLPGAEESDWPEFRKICRRVWDHQGESAHDPYGPFTVNISDSEHYITDGLSDFETSDELYYKQSGTEPVEALITALSGDTGQDEPLAWVYSYGQGRIFQSLLGHDAASLSPPEVQEMLLRAALWVSNKD